MYGTLGNCGAKLKGGELPKWFSIRGGGVLPGMQGQETKESAEVPLPVLERQSPPCWRLLSLPNQPQSTFTMYPKPSFSPCISTVPTQPLTANIPHLDIAAPSYLISFLPLLSPLWVRDPRGSIWHSKRGAGDSLTKGLLMCRQN